VSRSCLGLDCAAEPTQQMTNGRCKDDDHFNSGHHDHPNNQRVLSQPWRSLAPRHSAQKQISYPNDGLRLLRLAFPRLATHARGQGAQITRSAVAHSVAIHLVAVWPRRPHCLGLASTDGAQTLTVLDRLGFRSRSQIAVWATERGLVEDAHVSFR
jgi:hypothetical protein